MPGAFGSWRGAALYLLVWLMFGVLAAGVLASGGAHWDAALLFALPLALLNAFDTGFSSYYLCRARPLADNRLAALVVTFSLAAAFAAGLWTAAALGWHALVRALAPALALASVDRPFMLAVFGVGVIVYWLSVLGHYLAVEASRARQLETRELQTRLMAQQAELRMLRTQVDPHFLFNSLNSVSALTTIDPGAARAMVLELAAFFRHSLGLEAHRKVTLEQELQLVRHFIAIEQVRFGPRLGYRQEVADDALPCLLPPMLLQPLVENAVKHGIAAMLEPGTIRLSAVRAGSMLRVEVENDVEPGDAPTPAASGIGLVNVRQRLAAAYAHEAGVHWRREGALFRVELTLPVETGE
jgi:two-component system sensor histidine kinase AlgZ